MKGIEPSSQAWEARILPLNHTRLDEHGYFYSKVQRLAIPKILESAILILGKEGEKRWSAWERSFRLPAEPEVPQQ